MKEQLEWLDKFLDEHFGDDIIDGFRMERLDDMLKRANISAEEKEQIHSQISLLSTKTADKIEQYLADNMPNDNLDEQFKQKINGKDN